MIHMALSYLGILSAAVVLSQTIDDPCQKWDLTDITVKYQNIFKRNMVKVTNPEKGKYKHKYIGKEAITHTDVTFNISVGRCSGFPSGIIVQWNFGDGSDVIEETPQGFQKTHRYYKRGKYDFIFHFSNSTATETQTGHIYIGIANSYTVSDLKVIVNGGTYFTVTPHSGLETEIKHYCFFLDDTISENNQTTASQVYRKLTYPKLYLPKVHIHLRSDLEEVLYSSTPLAVDYNLAGGGLTLSSSQNPVYLPPGDNVLSMTVSSLYTLGEATCDFQTGDKVNRTVFTFDHNFGGSYSLSVQYRHFSLGTMKSTAYCYNRISEFRTYTEFEVVNPCFRIDERFDRKYSMPETAMDVSYTEDVLIYARSAMICKEMASFEWRVEKVELVTEGQYFKYTFKNITNRADSTTNALLIPKYTFVDSGLYKITCTVRISSTWMDEYTFVKIFRAPPRAFIMGGEQVNAKEKKDTKIELNAVDVSYQEKMGDGGNLEYSWTCNSSDKENKGCPSNEQSGKWELKMDQKKAYDIVVTVKNKEKSSSFRQHINRVRKEVPLIEIRCLFNCGQKHVASKRIIFKVVCTDCKSRRKNYQWTLLRYDSSRFVPQDIENLILSHNTQKQIIIFKEKSLDPSSRYKLKVEQKEIWSRCRRFIWSKGCKAKNGTASQVSVELETVSPPANGECLLEPQSATKDIDGSLSNYMKCPFSFYGYALTTSFNISCDGWTSGYTSDGSFKYPLFYNYNASIFQRIGDETYGFSTVLYSGYESSVKNLKLPAGYELSSREVDISVQVIDYLGEMQEWTKTVTVYPLNETLTSDEEYKQRVLFENFDSLTEEEKRNGNYLSQLNLIVSLSSMFTNESTTDNSLYGIQTILSKTTSCNSTDPFIEKRLISEYSKKVEEIVNNTYRIVDITYDNDGYKTLKLPVINQISWTIHSVTRYHQYLTTTSIEQIFKIFKMFAQRYDENYKFKPFLMKYKDTMDSIAKGMLTVLRSIIVKITSEVARVKWEEVNDSMWKYAEEKNCKKYLENFLKSTREDFQSKHYAYHKEIEKIVTELQTTLISVLVKGESMELDLFGTKFNLTRTELADKSVGIDIPMLDEEDEISCEEYEYDGSYNPYAAIENGNNVNTLVKTSHCSTGHSLPIVIKLTPSEGFQRIEAQIDSNDPEQMIYLTLNASKKAIIMYFRPVDIDIQSRKRNSIYTVYVRHNVRPTTRVHDFSKKLTLNDWSENLGFKVFVHKGVCGNNTCFLGFKPLNVKIAKSPNSTKSRSKRQTSSSESSSKNSSKVDLLDVDLDALVTTVGCSAKKDNGSWEDDSCQPLPMSSIYEVRCRCVDIPSSQLGVVYGSSFDAVNPINFRDAFLAFDISNAAVYGTIVAILILYVFLIVILRRKDIEDIDKWTIRFLCDNGRDDEYFYLVTVITGLRAGAGTTSVVNFVLYGEFGDSGIRVLSNDLKMEFSTGSVNRFVMSTSKHLGRLLNLWIWHDFSGNGPYQNWYLSTVSFDDMTTRERYFFHFDTWFALDKFNGLTECLANALGKNDSKVHFSDQLFYNLTENNLWVSTFLRPDESSFTRVQRLSCVVTFFFLAMLGNAMFYQAPGFGEEVLKIGIISFSLTTIISSLKSVAVTTLPVLFVTLVFKHTKEKETKSNVKGISRLIKQKPKTLPFWMRYVAWATIVLMISSSAVILILYSMLWGKAKSNEWLSSFMFSFFESATCVDPLKVLFVAALFSFVVKDPNNLRHIELDADRLKKYSVYHIDRNSSCYLEFVGAVFHQQKPSNNLKTPQIRKRQRQTAYARKSFRDLVVSLVMASSVVAIGYAEFDVQSFYLQDNVRNYLVSNGYGQFGFSAVNDTVGFYQWMNRTFIPANYPEKTYSGAELDILQKQMFGDLASIRVGPARIRQVRMPERRCDVGLFRTGHTCCGSYEALEEDKEHYCPNWKRGSCLSTGFIPDAWSYVDSSTIWGLPISAVYNTYSGGGYFFLLDEERSQALRQIKDAEESNWIDRYTRAVITELTLYNPNSDMFLNVVLVLEVLEHGFAIPDSHLRPFTKSLEFDQCSVSLQASFAIFFIYIIVLFVDIVHQLITNCKNVVRTVWLWVDIIFGLASVSSIILFIVRKGISDKAVKMFYDQTYTGENQFINFYQIIVLNIVIQVLLGFISFMAILRVLRAFEYSKKLSAFWVVIANSARPLLGFFVIFVITLCAFASLVYLLFGKHVFSFRNMQNVFGSLANTLIGKNDVKILTSISPLFALVFYFTYGCSVSFLLLNVFAAILNETIDRVKRDAKQSDIFGIGDYILSVAKDIVSIIHPVKRRIANLTRNQTAEDPEKDHPRNGEAEQGVDVHSVIRVLRWVFRTNEKEKVRKSSYAESYIISDDEDSVQENPQNDKEIDELCLSNHKSYKFL